jgi:tRNA-Thr(GGU) m(6)t(6)A37 methyltransferase TsaA
VAGKSPEMVLKAIGIVRSGFRQSSAERLNLEEMACEIEIDPGLTEALDGLEGFSHIIVLYWMHRATSDRVSLKVHPMGRKDVPVQGIFAVRTPNRPNRIGKSTVRLLQRQGNILRVQGLDALDGSPVLDIKPYIPGYDSANNARVPSWITK